jgi:hypothetical protein
LVPDIGAPAERVRAMQFGVIFPFPIDAAQVLQLIEDVIAERVPAYAGGAHPEDFHPGVKAVELTRKILDIETTAEHQKLRRKASPGASEKLGHHARLKTQPHPSSV